MSYIDEYGELIDSIFCTFCGKLVYSDKTNWKKCRHFVSVNDDYVKWDNGR